MELNYDGPESLLCSLRNKGGATGVCVWGRSQNCSKQSRLISRAGQGSYRF